MQQQKQETIEMRASSKGFVGPNAGRSVVPAAPGPDRQGRQAQPGAASTQLATIMRLSRLNS